MLVRGTRWYPIVLCIFFSFFLIGRGFSQTPEHLRYDIINSFASPGPSPQGLAWDENYLWVSDDSTDTLYKVDPSEGWVILSFPTPGPKPRGLTRDGTHLWCSDSDSVKIFKLDPTNGSVLSSIPAPVSGATNVPPDQVRGLTWDGKYLWSAYFAGWSSKVNQLDPRDGTVIRSFFCDAEGLAFDGEYLWIVDSQDGHYKGFIDKRDFSGRVISYFRTPGYYPTGLTFDGTYFWLADSGVDTLYKIKVITTGVETPRIDLYLPDSFRLHQNYPNPFNQYTMVIYELPFDSRISLKIFNINGQLIKTLVDEEKRAGVHEVDWDGRNNFDQYVSSGIYLYQIKTKRFFKTKEMILIR